MKFFAKILLAALVLALLLPFTILKDDRGKTLMSFSDFSLPEMPSFGGVSKLTPSSSSLGGKDTFYRWYDAEGNVQFTTEPPADGIEYTVKGYDPNTNVIQAVKTPAAEAASAPNVPASTGETSSELPEVNPYDAESVKKLIEDTKNIEKLLNQRQQNQNATLNQ
ncbi:MAG: DUF4124 domain-containing protein [Gammaproteobacteria bacterium]|nr:DUF4124 domain-containing protein [Gammaproteobacteria bacterium]